MTWELLTDVAAELLRYFQLGGFVMPPLAIATLVLWYMIGLRWQHLQRGNTRSARVLLERYQSGYARRPTGIIDTAVAWGLSLKHQNSKHPLRPILDDAYDAFSKELRRGRVIIRVIVAAAPLAGLLGTVIGMIETFDSLGEMALFTQSGGIAGGISQALFTTQMGLAVAVPGIVVGRILDRKEQRFREELEQVKDLLCALGPSPRDASTSSGSGFPQQIVAQR